MPTSPPAGALTAAQSQAVNEFVRVVLGRLKNDGGVHAETAIAAAAGLAGTYLLRSFALPMDGLAAGSPVFSAPADEHGPALVATIIDTLATLDLRIDTARVPAQVPGEHRGIL